MWSILAYNLKNRFFPQTQFSQNHIANYSASFTAQKAMLPSLKCHIFRFWSKFVSSTQLSRQRSIFQNMTLLLFSIYGKIYSCKKIKKIHGVDPEKNASQTNGQKDGQMNRKNQWQIFKKKLFWSHFCPSI